MCLGLFIGIVPDAPRTRWICRAAESRSVRVQDFRQQMLVRKLGSALALGVMAVTSCGDPVAVQTAVGYDLTLLNGAPLPVEVTPFYTILTGSLVLVSDGTCRRTVRVRAPADPMTTALVESESSWGCTWTQNGSALSFTWVDAEGDTLFPFPGTLVSSSIQQGRISHHRFDLVQKRRLRS